MPPSTPPPTYAVNVAVPVKDPDTGITLGHRAKWHGTFPGEIVRHFTNRKELRSMTGRRKWHCDSEKRPNGRQNRVVVKRLSGPPVKSPGRAG